jgi:phosphoribosylaminoimidazolecarboxamide formyltransferase/IMP cyclohydrolase
MNLITRQTTTIEDRKLFATKAFHVSSHYDTAIFNYFNTDERYTKKVLLMVKYYVTEKTHIKRIFFGDFEAL